MDDNASLGGVVIIALIVVGLLLSRREQHKTYPEQRETCPDCGAKLTEACSFCQGTGKFTCMMCRGSGRIKKVHICQKQRDAWRL
jgi:RecJ-like exonuclease